MLGDMCGDDAFAACALVACDARGGVGGADAARAAVRDVVEFVREHRGELAAATAALRPTWRADGDDDDAADGGGEGAAARCVVLPREEAELLCDYLSACTSAAAGGDDDDASAAAALRRQLIAALVPACLRLLATPCGGDVEDAATATATTTTPATHERARRLLLAAFDADFVGVTAAVAAALSPVLLQPLLRNAARYVDVGECVIALLGSALPATTLARPTTHPTPRFLSAAWLSARLPRQLVAHARVAAGDARGGALFFLARELVLRGGSCGAGPVADELLTRDAVALLADDAAASCERALAGDDADVAAPLCHAAVGVLAQMVRLSRRTLLPPWHLYDDEDDEDDDAPPAATAAGVCAPVCVLLSRLPRFAALLRDDVGDGACRCCRGGALAACVRRAARAAVCELLVELALLRRADVDAALCACDAVALLVRQCRLHPHSDRLARALRGLVGELAARQPHSRGDALIASALRRSDGAAAESPPLLLASLVDFAASRCTALSAFSVGAVDELLAPLRGDGDDEASRPLAAALRRVLRARGGVAADVAARVRDGRDVVTGARFRARGSVVAAPPVTHRAVVNCAGDRYTLRRDSGSGSGSAMDALPDDSVGEARRDTDKENARVSRAGGEKRGGGGGGGEGGVLARLAGEAAAAREHGSPQLRAYPEFRLMHITFGGGGGGGGGA